MKKKIPDYSKKINKMIIISIVIIVILTIILSVGLNNGNYFNWLSEIDYNPKIV